MHWMCGVKLRDCVSTESYDNDWVVLNVFLDVVEEVG